MARAVLLLLLLVGALAGLVLNVPVRGPNAAGAFHFGVTKSGAQMFLDIVIPLLNQQFQATQLPDMQVQEHVSLLGDITLEIKNFWIDRFHINSAAASTAAPNLFSFSVNGVDLHMRCDWRWKQKHWPHTSDHGNAEITPEVGELGITAALTPDGTKHLHATCMKSSCSFDKFKIKFGGHWDSWLYNLFVGLFSKSIRKSVEKAVEEQLANIINTQLNQLLALIPTETHIGGGQARSIADIGFIETTATDTFWSAGLAFSIRNNETGEACPLPLVPSPQFDTSMSGRHLELLISTTPFSCALWTPFVNGVMKFNVADKTNNWALWVPTLAKQFPNMSMVDTYRVTSLPELKLSASSGFSAFVPMAMEAYVLSPDGQQQKRVFVLSTNASLALTERVEKQDDNWVLFLNITQLKVQLGVYQSDIGPIDLSLLQSFLSVATDVIRGAVDLVLKNGFPLPVGQGLTLINPMVHIGDDFLEVGADVGWNPNLVKDPLGYMRGAYQSP